MHGQGLDGQRFHERSRTLGSFGIWKAAQRQCNLPCIASVHSLSQCLNRLPCVLPSPSFPLSSGASCWSGCPSRTATSLWASWKSCRRHVLEASRAGRWDVQRCLGVACIMMQVGVLRSATLSPCAAPACAQRMHHRPPLFVGRSDLETLLASDNAADWCAGGQGMGCKSGLSLWC